MNIRNAHILLISTAILGGLAFTLHAGSAALAGAPEGSWLAAGLAAGATIGFGVYLKGYVRKSAVKTPAPQASDSQ
jgi:hypothetical protein